jgi:hypothetical protein
MRQIVNPGCRRTFVPGDLLSDLYGDKKGDERQFQKLFRFAGGLFVPFFVVDAPFLSLQWATRDRNSIAMVP